MTTFLEWLAVFTEWTFFTSLKATIVISLILFIRIVFGSKLPPKWAYALWFLLILRLIFPFDLPSVFSIFNITDEIQYQTLPPLSFNSFPNEGEIARPGMLAATGEKNYSISNKKSQFLPGNSSWSWLEIAGLIWLAGSLGLLLLTLLINIRERIHLKNSSHCENERILRLFEQCKQRLDISQEIGIYEVSGIKSPFYLGILKPRILIPSTITHSFSEQQLTHIFLHELAHYKRKDIPVALLSLLLQILHWFNPVIWYSFLVMRNDRETACDELVLDKLGQAQAQNYGQTLLALVRHTKHHRLLPATLGLADSHANLKRRILMIANFSKKSKWWALVTISILLALSVVALSSAKKQAVISGNITLQGGVRPDTLYVGLYDFHWSDYWFASGQTPYQLERLTQKDHFKFKVQPGLYTLVTWGIGFEPAQCKIFVEDEKASQRIHLALAQKGLPENIQRVLLVGQYCNWDHNKAVEMKKEGNVWRLEKIPENFKIGQKYKFRVWDRDELTSFSDFLLDQSKNLVQSYSPCGANLKVAVNWCTFSHIYNGEEIIFDPSCFVQPPVNAIVENPDYVLTEQLNRLPREMDFFELEMVQPINSGSYKTNRTEHFNTMYAKLDSIAKTYDSRFQSFFDEKKLRLYELFSPLRDGLQALKTVRIEDNSGIRTVRDSTELAQYFASENFKKHYSELVGLCKKLDSKNWFYQGWMISNLFLQIPMFLDLNPTLEREYGFSRQDCQAKMEDLAFNAVNPSWQQDVLYDLYSRYEVADSAILAAKYKKMLYDKFPKGWALNEIEKTQNDFSWNPVEPYPAKNFKVTTLKGDTLELALLKGKFVFIVFWDSGCQPCLKELPHLIQMAELYPVKKLQVIGLARDDEKALRKYLEKNPLPYPNAIADSSILKAWKVDQFPGSFLINPEGKVIARDFRGQKTMVKVGQLIAEYFEKQLSSSHLNR